MRCARQGVCAAAAQYPLAALIERFAATFFHHSSQQIPDCFYAVHQIVEFRKLALGQFQPALRNTPGIAEAEKKLPDFVQSKTKLTRPLKDCQPVQDRCVVPSSPGDSSRGGKQADLL